MTAPTPPIEIAGPAADVRSRLGEPARLDPSVVDALAAACPDTTSDAGLRAEVSRDWWPLAMHWALAGQGKQTAAILALCTLSISLVVSQIRAEGEALGVKLSEGIFQRLERYVALMVGLTAPGALLPVLAILTGLGGITIAQRSWSAWRGLSKPAPPAEPNVEANAPVAG